MKVEKRVTLKTAPLHSLVPGNERLEETEGEQSRECARRQQESGKTCKTERGFVCSTPCLCSAKSNASIFHLQLTKTNHHQDDHDEDAPSSLTLHFLLYNVTSKSFQHRRERERSTKNDDGGDKMSVNPGQEDKKTTKREMMKLSAADKEKK